MRRTRDGREIPAWDHLLERGTHKVQESDSLYGPWTDAFMGDDGSIRPTKRYTRCRPKDYPEGCIR
jgi:hypothetical protein